MPDHIILTLHQNLGLTIDPNTPDQILLELRMRQPQPPPMLIPSLQSQLHIIHMYRPHRIPNHEEPLRAGYARRVDMLLRTLKFDDLTVDVAIGVDLPESDEPVVATSDEELGVLEAALEDRAAVHETRVHAVGDQVGLALLLVDVLACELWDKPQFGCHIRSNAHQVLLIMG